jgi:hypothetical protein
MQSEPTVLLPDSKYDGLYKLNREPRKNLVPHNATSWNIVSAMFKAHQTADFRDLAVAVRNHKHYGTDERYPQNFIKYCIRSGWLSRAL